MVLHRAREIQAFRLTPPSCLSFVACLEESFVQRHQTSGQAFVASFAGEVFRGALRIAPLIQTIESRNVQVRLFCLLGHLATYQGENYALALTLWRLQRVVDRLIFLPPLVHRQSRVVLRLRDHLVLRQFRYKRHPGHHDLLSLRAAHASVASFREVPLIARHARFAFLLASTDAVRR